jgi:hypothetical protein
MELIRNTDIKKVEFCSLHEAAFFAPPPWLESENEKRVLENLKIIPVPSKNSIRPIIDTPHE